MAKVAKRRDRYILDYYDHEGCRKRRTMPKGTTKKAAQDELDAIRKTCRPASLKKLKFWSGLISKESFNGVGNVDSNKNCIWEWVIPYGKAGGEKSQGL